MSKNFKTIAILQETDSICIAKSKYNSFHNIEISKNTFILEAYSSLEQAFDALDEEIMTCINEIIFKNCNVINFDICYDLADQDPISFYIDYTSDNNKIYRSLYEIVIVNLEM